MTGSVVLAQQVGVERSPWILVRGTLACALAVSAEPGLADGVLDESGNGTFHFYSFEGQKRTSSGTVRGDIDFSEDFHVYALEWEPDSLRWFLDGVQYHATATGVPTLLII